LRACIGRGSRDFSGLVLNFVPDPRRALQEMRRVATTLVGAYVWDYADKMQLMRCFSDAAAEVDPARPNWMKACAFRYAGPKRCASLSSRPGCAARRSRRST
jgi:hypothetical protein